MGLQVRGSVSSMLFVDLMFWKTAAVAEEVSAGYFLKLAAEGALHKATGPESDRAARDDDGSGRLNKARSDVTNSYDQLGDDMSNDEAGRRGAVAPAGRRTRDLAKERGDDLPVLRTITLSIPTKA